MLSSLPAVRVGSGAPVVLLHGIGLGAWIWERDQRLLAERGFESWAVDLPGHGALQGEVGLDELLDQTIAAISELDHPLVVGHSLGGLVAQVVADCLPVRGVVLVSPMPPKEVHMIPTRRAIKDLPGHLPALIRGRALHPSKDSYAASGLPERYYDRVGDWPGHLVRDLVKGRPSVPRLECPVLVTHGFRDPLVPLWQSRLISDHHDGILWRFDDLAHHPMLEEGGERHLSAVADWLAKPRRRRIREIDPMSPQQGVGADERARRAGSPVRSNSRFGDRFKGRR